MPSPTQITSAQLFRLIGTPSCPPLIDVCTDEDFNQDPRLIPSAWRFPYDNIEALAPQFLGQKVIIICQKGKKLSQGAAALLRSCGVLAESLQGGNYAWRDDGYPLVPVNKIPFTTQTQQLAPPLQQTLWVTRHRPKIDRIACPWLIRRFIDPSARFLFVAPSEVANVAQKFNATPFDIENSFWGHRQQKCTFDTMLEEWQLQNHPALAPLAVVVRAADTDQLEQAPQAAGLLSLSLGLSRLYKDDLQQLEAGLLLYDCLYMAFRDAYNETHNCNPNNERPHG